MARIKFRIGFNFLLRNTGCTDETYSKWMQHVMNAAFADMKMVVWNTETMESTQQIYLCLDKVVYVNHGQFIQSTELPAFRARIKEAFATAVEMATKENVKIVMSEFHVTDADMKAFLPAPRFQPYQVYPYLELFQKADEQRRQLQLEQKLNKKKTRSEETKKDEDQGGGGYFEVDDKGQKLYFIETILGYKIERETQWLRVKYVGYKTVEWNKLTNLSADALETFKKDIEAHKQQYFSKLK